MGNVQGVMAKKASKAESVESVETKPDSKLSSSSEIWVETPAAKSDDSYSGSTQPSDDTYSENSKPSLIIYLIAISLILFVGIMVFSIFNTGSKKKSTSQINEDNSNFKLLDSLNLDGSRNLYLVRLFDRHFLIASTLTSISLISEVNADSIESQIAESIEAVQKPENNLDFMTMSTEEKSGFDALLRDETEIQTSRNLKNKVNSNFFSKKTLQPESESVVPKLTQILPNTSTTIEEEVKKPQVQTSTSQNAVQKSKLASDFTPSARSSEIIPPARVVKKPNWLQEREARVKQIEAKLAAKEKSSSEKSILKTQQTLKNTFVPREREKEIQIPEVALVEKEEQQEKIVVATELAANVNAVKNTVEEISQVQKPVLSSSPVVKTRKISIVED